MASRDESEGRKMKPVGLESIGRLVDDSRAGKSSMHPWQEEVIVALADENDRLRAERDEMIALLDTGRIGKCPTCGRDITGDKCTWEIYGPCWNMSALELLEKLRTP